MVDKAVPLQGTSITTMNGASFVQVVAPMDLQEGYQMQVNVNGQIQSVTVPAGGVKEGESFQAQSMATTSAGGVVHVIPSGKWRDGLCDCCQFGCCHAMCCFGLWCQPILAGQVMTRMARDWLGGPGPRPSASNTCMIVTGIYVFVMVAQLILQGVGGSTQCFGGRERYNQDTETFMIECPDGSWEEQTTTYTTTNLINGIISLLFWLFMLIVVCRTREAMRKKYNIAPGGCGGCEDCCCSCWCGCCTVEQMARHTNDYNQYDVACCSNDCCNKRGQQDIVPEIEP